MTDLVSYILTNDLSGDFLPRNLGAFIWQKPKLYQSRSPIYHGDKDKRVPLSQGLEFYNLIRLCKIPTTMLIYPNQSHALTNPQFILDASNTNLQWINHYI